MYRMHLKPLLPFKVLSVLNIIDPGCNRERGVVLRHLSEVKKLRVRKMFQVGFNVILFNKCNILIFF